MATKLPTSISNAVKVLIAVAIASGVVTVLTLLQGDEIIIAWSKGNPSATAVLAEGGIEALKASELYVPKFGQLVIVSLIWFLMLVWVLAACLVGGHGWSRIWLTATTGVGVLVAVVTLANHLPASFVVVSVVILVLDLLLIYLLWHKDTTAYLRSFSTAAK